MYCSEVSETLVVKIVVFLPPRQLKSKNQLQKRVPREKLTLVQSGEVSEGDAEFHIAVWSYNFRKIQNVTTLQDFGSMLVKCTLKGLFVENRSQILDYTLH